MIGCMNTIVVSGALFALCDCGYGEPSPENLVGFFCVALPQVGYDFDATHVSHYWNHGGLVLPIGI